MESRGNVLAPTPSREAGDRIGRAAGADSERHATAARPLVVTAMAMLGSMSGIALWALFGDPKWSVCRLCFGVPTVIVIGTIVHYAVMDGRRGILSPPAMFMIGCLVFLSSAPLLAPDNVYGRVVYEKPERCMLLAAAYLVGVLAFLLGTALVRMRRRAVPRRRRAGERLQLGRLSVGFVILILASASVALFATRQLGLPLRSLFLDTFYSRDPDSAFASVDPRASGFIVLIGFRYAVHAIAVLSGVLAALSKRAVVRLTMLGIAVVCGAYIFAMGTRFVFVYVAVGTLLAYARVRRIAGPADKGRGSSAIGRTLLFVAVAVLTFQMIAVRSAGGVAAYAAQPSLVGIHRFIELGIDQGLFLDEVFLRVPGYRPFLHGASLASTVVLFVPRSLWPDKPRTAWSYMEGFISDRIESPNVSYTFLGELYMNFGWAGIPVGCLVAGFLCRYLYGTAKAASRTIVFESIYWMSIPAFAFVVRGDFQVAVGSMLYPVLVVWFILRMSSLRRPR